MTENLLYYGDNLDVLRRHVADESVDLVYLDPPFNSARNYNVLFAEQDGSRAAAQIQAFEDTWRWDESASAAYYEVVEGGAKPSQALQAFRLLLGDSDMLAYLSMMAPRLMELHRVLKQTGSMYLHCDTTASHYLKIVTDAIFGKENFRNEISWRRSQTRSSISKSYRRAHDILLFYTKSDDYTFHMQFKPLSAASEKLYENQDEKGRAYQAVPLIVSGKRNGETGRVWRGIDPNTRGKDGMHWVTTPDKLDAYDREGRVLWPNKAGGVPRLKYYKADSPGVPLSDLWDDIDVISSSSSEALGYPTQKPVALLDRIVAASSNPGDVVLDPFCGCGTTIAAAQGLGRRWVGIDVTHLAIGLIRTRLRDTYGAEARFEVIGEPTTVEDAAELARAEPYQFQAWALGLVGARQAGAVKKGADKGIDGRLYFHDGSGKETKQVIFSVKAGGVHRSQVHELRGVIEREGAQIGVLLSFESPTRPMREEAASAEFYESPWGKHPKLQLLTVGELLDGKKVDMPQTAGINRTYKQAPRALRKVAEPHPRLFDDEDS